MEGFKALSRMSSFPTRVLEHKAAKACGFQSAVAHELISNMADGDVMVACITVSKRCRA